MTIIQIYIDEDDRYDKEISYHFLEFPHDGISTVRTHIQGWNDYCMLIPNVIEPISNVREYVTKETWAHSEGIDLIVQYKDEI